MRRIACLLLVSITIFSQSGFCDKGAEASPSNDFSVGSRDSVFLRQELYNGKVWRNIYSHRVTGSQFLYTREFLPGSVIMNGRLFRDLELRYDTYNDELLIMFDSTTIIQLNKEMIGMFTLTRDNIQHKFIRLEADSISPVDGFVDVIYEGKTPLCVKNKSEISRLAQGRTYDVFINTQRIYLKKGGALNIVRGKRDLLELLSDKEELVRHYMKANRIRVSKKAPESFVPVLKFYDNMIQ